MQLRLASLAVLVLPLLACSDKPKQCDPVACRGFVHYSTTVTMPDRTGDFSLTVCRAAKCGKTAFAATGDPMQRVALVDPIRGQLVLSGALGAPVGVGVELEGGEGSFAQGDVWELTLEDVTRGATLLHTISTPTSYTLDEPAGAGRGGCLSATILAR